jgi:hypothetical protein
MAGNHRLGNWFVFLLSATLAAATGCQKTPVAQPTAWEVEKSQSSIQKIVDSAHGTQRLVVYTDGGPARLLRVDCVRLNGFNAAVLDSRTGAVLYETGGGEADHDIVLDYSRAEVGVYVLTDYTKDPRITDEDGVPFVETTVRIDASGHCEEKERLLLTAEPGGPEQFTRWRSKAVRLIKANKGDSQEFCDALGHIRNLSFDHPQEAVQAMHGMRPDGCAAELWGNYMWEIEVIAKLTGRPLSVADRGH